MKSKITIYCSNSYEVFKQKHPNTELIDYDYITSQPKGLKELSESFIEKLYELLNNNGGEIYTLSDVPLNIVGLLIADKCLDCNIFEVIFEGIIDKEIIEKVSTYDNQGFLVDWYIGCMSSYYDFYKHLIKKLFIE